MTAYAKRRRIRRLKTRPARCQISNKVRYRDHRDAKLALRTLRFTASALTSQDRSHSIHVVRCYRCPDCRGWHLTSKAQWASAASQ